MLNILKRKQIIYLLSIIMIFCIYGCNYRINSSRIHFSNKMSKNDSFLMSNFLSNYKNIYGIDYLSYDDYKNKTLDISSDDRSLISPDSRIISIKKKNIMQLDSNYSLNLIALKLKDSLTVKLFTLKKEYVRLVYLAIEDNNTNKIKDLLLCSYYNDDNDGLSHFKMASNSLIRKDSIILNFKIKLVSSDFGGKRKHPRWTKHMTIWKIDKTTNRFVKTSWLIRMLNGKYKKVDENLYKSKNDTINKLNK